MNIEAVAVLVHHERLIAIRLRSFQQALDSSGGDRDVVARIAGSLLDLAEDMERSANKLADEIKARAAE